MKYLSLLFILASFSSNAQPSIYNISLTDSTKAIFYVGVENQLSFIGVNTVESAFSIENGMLKTRDKRSFAALVNTPGQKATIKIVRKGRTVIIKEFEIYALPGITATIGYIYDSIATVNKILANPFVTAGCRCYYKMFIGIPSFRLTIKKTDAEDIQL